LSEERFSKKGKNMLHSEAKAREVFEAIVKEIKIPQAIESVSYRSDYQDYRIILNNNSHAEIREKILDLFITEKHADSKKEIVFRLMHPVQFEEWE
jgi:hypothetical protein